jgi:hypothetical protein
MLGYDERCGTYLVMNKKGSTHRSRVTRWYENTFTFYEAEAQIPSKAKHRAKTSKENIQKADDTLREIEGEIDKELEIKQIAEKNQSRRTSRSKRVRKNRLNFIPGVNYVPGMYYLNAMEEADDAMEPDVNLYHKNMMKEFKESSNMESRPECLLSYAIQSMKEIENIPTTYKKAILAPDKQKWIESMKDELKSQRDRNTWKIVERPKHKNVV